MSDSLTEGMYAERASQARTEAQRRESLSQVERDEEDLEKKLASVFNQRYGTPNGKLILELLREVIALELRKQNL